jgi:SAM-dependent methyltransferase
MIQPDGSQERQRVPFEDVTDADRFLRSFYSHAELYSIVAKQNYSLNICWFLLGVCQDLGLHPIGSGLELACGPALVAVDLAALGIRMSGVDTSPEMLEVARKNAEDRQVSLSLYEGDMISFRATDPVDLVISLGYNSGHILTNDEMLSHLDAVADSLRPGGLYVLDLEFLVPKYLNVVKAYDPPWAVYETRPVHVAHGFVGPLKITVKYGDGLVHYDPIRQIYKSRNTITLRRDDQTEVIEAETIGKFYLPLEFKALVSQSGRFEFVEWYEDYSRRAKFDGRPEAEQYITVLRRKPLVAGVCETIDGSVKAQATPTVSSR